MGQYSFVHEGRRLKYEIHGSGDRVVVLLHGILLDASVNRPLAKTLAANGYRVMLLDLLGHGQSDKPTHASEHRMDLYAMQVVGLLDELQLDRVALGGVSLGADVALQAAIAAPDRTLGLILEMPVLERATPAAALLFVPALLAFHYCRSLLRVPTRLFARLPRTGLDFVDMIETLLALHPDEAAAVLHGVLLGPIAPTVQQRKALTVPTLVIGHRHDPIHPHRDAVNLSRQLPHARLITAKSMAELRASPDRLLAEILAFLESLDWSSSPGDAPAVLSNGSAAHHRGRS